MCQINGLINEHLIKKVVGWSEYTGFVFSIRFLKKDGSLRNMVCRRNVKKGVKGIGLKFSPADKGLYSVYDMHNGFRFIPREPDRVVQIKYDHMVFESRRYKHHNTEDEFLGQYREYDLYYSTDEIVGKTVIARFGSQPHQYNRGLFPYDYYIRTDPRVVARKRSTDIHLLPKKLGIDEDDIFDEMRVEPWDIQYHEEHS